ncbi:MAG: DUF2442 domain-containing protein [Gammaproteobacteria bacterium]|nr:DUF2442 domain-containing protein [Gammaproteobacteria bacterium]
MSTLAIDVNPLAEAIQCTEDELIVSLVDGRKISAPLAWFPCLANASMEERNNWELLGDGQGIHWPDIDEDLSVSGLLKGTQLDG